MTSGPVPPLLSVVVPTYNRASILPRALGSLMAQQWENFEVLVCDDGSDDNTAEVVIGVGDPRVRYLRQENRGVSAARNLGIAHARGTAVSFLDSDDEVAPSWLNRLAGHFSDPRVGIVCTGARVIESAGEEGARVERLLLPGPIPPLFGPHPVRYPLSGMLAARLDLLHAIGGYDEHLRYSENMELILRLLPACLEQDLEVRSVDQPLVTYHRDATAWRGDPERFSLIRQGVERILEVHGDMLRGHFPHGYARYRGVAAVNAGRLGDIRGARRHLLAALRAKPTDWPSYARLLMTLFPPLAKRYWCRHVARPEASRNSVWGKGARP